MWPLFYHDGLFVFILSLGSLLVILAWYPFDYYFSNVHHLYSFVLGLSFGTMIYGCMVLLWFSVLMYLLLLTLTHLTCSRRPEKFDESGHGRSVRWALWTSTDPVHCIPINTVSTDSSLYLLA